MRMGMIPHHMCDYCHQLNRTNKQGDLLYEIPLSRTPNGEKIQAEICTQCLTEIVRFLTAKFASNNPPRETKWDK